MTFNALVAAVQINAGRTDSTAVAKVTSALNLALQQIEAAGNWYWMEAVREADTPPPPYTVDNPSNRVLLPTDWKDTRQPPSWYDPSSLDQTLTPMFPIDEEEAIGLYGQANEKGDPERFRVWKGQMYLYPPQRDTVRKLRMLYWGWSTAISGEQSNELSTRWSGLWIARGTAEYLRAVREFKAADEWMGIVTRGKSAGPGTYVFELSLLKKDNALRKFPRDLGVRSNTRAGRQPLRKVGYPMWRNWGW